MADVIVKCPGCGNEITISEYASPEFLTCSKCKSKVTVPPRPPSPTELPKLKLGLQSAPAAPEPAPSPSSGTESGKDFRQFMPANKRGKRRRRRGGGKHLLWPWILFIVVGGTLAALRFVPGLLPADRLEMLTQAGVAAIFFMHFTIVVYAFADEAFDGVLCAIIPGYSLYFIFFKSDQFHFRALLSALLVAFGWDTSVAIKNFSHEFYVNTAHWMETTERFKKDRGP